MKTLICDLNVYENGHHIAFVNSIVEYSSDQENIIFLFNRQAASLCPGLREDKRVFFIDEEIIARYQKNVLIARFIEYKHIRQFALQHGIERLILLEIDQYQLAVGLMPAPFTVTGIYFRSFHSIRLSDDSVKRMLRNLAYYAKKKIIFQVYRLNRRTEALFLLNDRVASVQYPRYFKYLPDPVFTNGQLPSNPEGGTHSGLSNGFQTPAIPADRLTGSPESRDGIRGIFDIPASSHVFLAFGAMGARKNIANIVAAYAAADIEKQTVLLIAGKVREDYKAEFYNAVNGFIDNNKDPRKMLIFRDEFVGEDLLDLYFKGSDTIILCYKKFIGSSGLMGKAALHDKTCIVPNEGLLFDLCREYSLGYAANPEDINSIAGFLALSVSTPVLASDRRKFVNDHNENAFLRTILHI